jgi:hypothetical protein
MSDTIASTAIYNHTADQGSSSHTMIGIAGDALHGDQHAAADNQYLACVREDQPFVACVREEKRHPGACYGRGRNTKIMLAAAATFLVVLGVAVGVGLHFGLKKGESGVYNS